MRRFKRWVMGRWTTYVAGAAAAEYQRDRQKSVRRLREQERRRPGTAVIRSAEGQRHAFRDSGRTDRSEP